ncbi:endoglucanase [Saccharothrix ecbatanensis]|uniref:Endoglucanase n=1 Tax=Saccharothrix ecbatanensis TaxID=1105145 RepID=A0A7W9HLR7_9PSEU|nr:glycoside hydrolase family 9 protein [Saccharothrix ecbatanensis]MBB5804632.1 endoglucanase [Saccharothrix ecbatanensis]
MSGALASGTAHAADYERLINGTFASGADPWWASAGVSNRVVNGELCATVTGGTVNPWDSLIGQNGVPFEAGQSYTMSFDAYASVARPAAAVAGEGVSPYRQIAKHDVALTTTKQRFSFTFISELDFPDAGPGQVTFHLGAQAADTTVCVDNVSLIGGVKPPGGDPAVPAKKVNVDQVGYVPGLPKRATLTSDATAPQTWVLKNSAGTSVATGQTVPRGSVDPESGDSTHLIDFSSYDTAGAGYTLTVGTETSYPFDIATAAIKKLRYDSMAFFYHNRSGIEIEAQYVGAEYARPAGHLDVAPNKGDNNVPCLSTVPCGYTLDVRGGWYDAGDHGKYVVNGGISAWQVLNTYERAKLIGDAAALGDGTLAIPEKANGVPDILDEARWEVEFLLKMQAPDGMVHHKIHDANWTGLPMLPHQDPQARRLSATSTAATLNMAAVAAQSARIWKTIDPAFSAKAQAAAVKAYAAAKANPNKIADPNDGTGGGSYSDDKLTDEFYWAAAEMFATTGEASYRTDVTSSAHFKGASLNARGFDWGSTGPLGDITLALVPNGLPAADVTAIKSAFTTVADAHLSQMATQGYPAPYKPTTGYDWGSNGLIANNIAVLALAHDFTGAEKYRTGVFEGLHYLMGRNPMSYSYVTGYGDQPVKNVHHRHWANQLEPTLPIAPPGVLSGGPNSALQDPIAARLLEGCKPQKCFVDHIEAYSLNEVTVNWNSAFAWISNWAAEKVTTAPPVDTTPPSVPGTPVASDITTTSVSLTWPASTDAESGVKSYDVIVQEADMLRVAATVTSPSATVTGLRADTSYQFSVIAKNGANLTSAMSPRVTVRTKPVVVANYCKVRWQASSWSTGMSASITVTNTSGQAWTGWKLEFTMPGSQKITQGWSANWSQTGQSTSATNVSWNGSVANGGSANIGFNSSGSGAGEPTDFRVNGQSCSKG